MIKIGLFSEDRTLHSLLSSALGKDYEVLLEPDGDAMDCLVSAGGCDVMIVDLHSKEEFAANPYRVRAHPDRFECPGYPDGRR